MVSAELFSDHFQAVLMSANYTREHEVGFMIRRALLRLLASIAFLRQFLLFAFIIQFGLIIFSSSEGSRLSRISGILTPMAARFGHKKRVARQKMGKLNGN
jgi:hypothetical protein